MPTKAMLITSEYPPGNTVGFMRVAKFEKYLPQYDISTCVLTMRSYGKLPTDELGHVYRAWDIGVLYRPVTRFLLNKPYSVEANAEHPHVSPIYSAYEGTWLHHLRQFMLRVAVPDLQITWLPFAVWLGLKTIKKEKVDVIFSTSPIETSHLIAFCLAVLTRKPWVADFRDGWIFEPTKDFLRNSSLRKDLEIMLEQRVIKKASAITTVSQPLADYFLENYPEAQGKTYVITNGFDNNDLTTLKPKDKSPDRLRIVYTGSLDRPSYDPLPSLLQAFQLLPVDTQRQMELLLAGDLSDRNARILKDVATQVLITTVGRVSRVDSLEYQLSADVLLLFVGLDRSVATSKLFEYLNAQRLIFALSGRDTAAANIIRHTKSGIIVDPMDTEGIAQSLVNIFQQWQSGNLCKRPINIEKYDRKYLAGRLASIMRSLT
jgi:glycosyltransferase involved in cell wall biosynthesis